MAQVPKSPTAAMLDRRQRGRSAVEQVLGGAPVANGQPQPTPGVDLRSVLAPAMETIQDDSWRRMLQWVCGRWPAICREAGLATPVGEPYQVDRGQRLLRVRVQGSTQLFQLQAVRGAMETALRRQSQGKLALLTLTQGGRTAQEGRL